jgi:hypothetical protein
MDDVSFADDVGAIDHEALIAAGREVEMVRRRTEGELVQVMVELDRTRAYASRGYRDVAGWGRGELRWERTEARSRRGLMRLCTACPRVLELLLAGRLGVAQAHLLGRAFLAPRVGRLVAMFIDEFLDVADEHDYLTFEQHVREWKRLVDQDGPEPRHLQRSAALGFTDDEFHLSLFGPSADGALLKALLDEFEQFEWQLDWARCQETHGEAASAELMPRTAAQRRYDAVMNMIAHVGVAFTSDESEASDGDADPDDADVFLDDEAMPEPAPEPACPPGAITEARQLGGEMGPVKPVVNLVVDLRTFLQEMERMVGSDEPTQLPVPSPFGPDRPRCSTVDGIAVHPRDMILAAIHGRMRLVVVDETGRPVQATSAARCFTGRMRDMLSMLATHCTHPGCLVPASECQGDHLVPHSHGGATDTTNGGLGCGRHNLWRYTARARTWRRGDGVWITTLPDGTRVAPAS